MSQSESVCLDKILKRFNMDSAKKGFLPMSHGIRLSKTQCLVSANERSRMEMITYASTVVSIMYAMICTRPNVSYALRVTSRYQSDPGEGHLTAVKDILKYIKHPKDVFLVFGKDKELSVKGYTDAIS